MIKTTRDIGLSFEKKKANSKFLSLSETDCFLYEKWIKHSVLQDFVSKHRAKSILTCPEDCLCWDLDLILDGEFKE